MAILIDERKLSNRLNSIRKNLQFLNNGIAGARLNQNKKSVIIFVKVGSTNDYTELFKTTNDKIKANYFEVWQYKSLQELELTKLYFRIEQKVNLNDYQEILSFHIDLDTTDECYKKYPHIHVKHPKLECVSNAHISLNLNDYDATFKSLEALDNNISKVLKMINEEFIVKFNV
ncbi:MAG: hypothetical protein QM654_12945 [Dysgonamonadaceae bacterium]